MPKFLGTCMMFVAGTSLVYGLLPFVSPEIKTAEATTALVLRQEIDITDEYISASNYATSSAIIQIDLTEYSGTEVYCLK